MTQDRRDVFVIAACIVAAAAAVVGVVLLASIHFPPGFGLVPLISFVAVLFLVRWLVAVAHERRTMYQARRRAE